MNKGYSFGNNDHKETIPFEIISTLVQCEK